MMWIMSVTILVKVSNSLIPTLLWGEKVVQEFRERIMPWENHDSLWRDTATRGNLAERVPEPPLLPSLQSTARATHWQTSTRKQWAWVSLSGQKARYRRVEGKWGVGMESMEEIWPIYLKYMKLRSAMCSSVKITIDKDSLFKIFEKNLERDTKIF